MRAEVWGNAESQGGDKVTVPHSGLPAGLFHMALNTPDPRFSIIGGLCAGPGLASLRDEGCGEEYADG